MSSRRLVRVSESIRGVLARLVSRERTLEGMLLTITGVDVSPDLRHATVFVSHLDGRTPDEQILHDLNALKEEWQSEINKTLHIKYTPKQRAFAEAIAMGETKAGTYRRAYNSKGKPETQSRRGQELAKRGAVQAQVDAFRAAIEAQKYATPAHLRALVIEQLTRHALVS